MSQNTASFCIPMELLNVYLPEKKKKKKQPSLLSLGTRWKSATKLSVILSKCGADLSDWASKGETWTQEEGISINSYTAVSQYTDAWDY